VYPDSVTWTKSPVDSFTAMAWPFTRLDRNTSHLPSGGPLVVASDRSSSRRGLLVRKVRGTPVDRVDTVSFPRKPGADLGGAGDRAGQCGH